MIKFSLNSHRKKILLFLYTSGVFLLLVILISIFSSITIHKRLIEVKHLVTESGDFSFNIGFTYFNLFKGLTITGLDFRKGQEVLFSAGRIDIGFDFLSYFRHKICIKNISARQLHIDLNKISDIQSLLKRLMGRMDRSLGFFQTAYFKGRDVWLQDALRLDIQGYLSMLKDKLLISRGKLLIKKIQTSVVSDFDLFRASHFYESLDYVFEAESQDRDFVISRFELSNPFIKFTGLGRIIDVASTPEVMFTMNFLNVVLDDLPALNHQSMQSRGVVDACLNVNGLLTNLKALLNIKIANANFSFFDSLFLSKVNGSVLVSANYLVGQNFSLQVNDIPFAADLVVVRREHPHLGLELFSLTEVAQAPAFVLNLSADWVVDKLIGDIKTRLRYVSKDTINTMEFNLDNFLLGFKENAFVNVKELKTKFLVESATEHSKTKVLKKELYLNQLFWVIRKNEEGFILDDIKATCYRGALEGQLCVNLSRDQLNINGEARLEAVDLNEFFQKSPEASHVLLGKLSGNLKFDNSLADMFKGQLFVTDGLIDQDPLLNAVADFLGVPSLKKLAFKELSMFFSGGRGDYISQIKLESDDVNGQLDGKITSYDRMEGYLSVRILTKLLNESKQFKKLLAYIRHDEPFVTFPFKISSYIHSPRVLWLKNEFKEKLQNLLPERNKRFLQRQVNNLIEKIED